MSSEEVFKVTSFQSPAALKSQSTLCAIRYNFLPDSADRSSGVLSVGSGSEVTLNYSGNRHCKSGGNDHMYSGNQSIAKDYEYVLIVDRKNQTARIEKVHYSIGLRNIRRSRRLSSGNERSSSPVLLVPKKRTLSDESACFSFSTNSNASDKTENENVYSDVDEIESLNSEIFKDFI